MRKALWTLADQGMASLSNLLLTIVIARECGPDELGAFGAAFAIYLILTGLSRAVAAEPLLVRFSDVPPAEHRAGARACLGSTLVLGVAGLAVLLAGSALTAGPLGAALGALAWVLPALLVKDTLRFVFLAADRHAAAFACDLTWVTVQIAALAGILLYGRPELTWFILAWGLSAAAASLQGLIHARCLPSPARMPSWLRDHRDLLPGYVGDFAARSGGRQLTMLAVGWLGGLAALGAIRAAEVLFSVLNVMLQAGHLAAIPAAVAARRRGRLRRTTLFLGLTLAGASLVYGVAVLLVPAPLGQALVGETWRLAQPVLAAEVALYASIAAVTAAAVGLRAAGDARRGALVRLAVVPCSLAAGLAGAALGGAAGAILGLAVVNWLALPFWIQQFRRVTRADSRARADAAPAIG
ncbi:hypothetical protein [Nonomuraea endophytica]|uniref:hypothetical protein n=1 Tax=Nonomuraea endophytica TaxID=714136 RepID=UPI0037CA21A2